ncbi:MAG: S-adenosylmethionine:tRNA ribosyltransferase-isomerase [Chloroflexi bacterium]|nr:S-adenosylmethionine:tRNA ribosyltransferase-isomerase [Chloroflexota bacterium]
MAADVAFRSTSDPHSVPGTLWGRQSPSLAFVLPPELEATEPPEARGRRRDEVRLLVTQRDGERVVHAQFHELPGFLRAGDLVVVNDSATLPARLPARRYDGSELALHLSTRLPAGLWIVEARQVGVAAGEKLALPAGGAATLLTPYPESRRLWIARLELPAGPVSYLLDHGQPITYSYAKGAWPIELYQTLFAREYGSAEMPSAGRPFTPVVVEQLRAKGVRLATLTLHTGVASLEGDERPYAEPYRVPPATADAVNATRAGGGRVIAVGTTVVRALESAVSTAGRVVASQGWTELVVTPDRGVRAVDGLLTGLHEPRATHLAMLEAIAGRRHLEIAYEAALRERYLWHEFGDVHLLL